MFSPASSPTLAAAVAERSGASLPTVQEAIAGHCQQIRQMPEMDAIGRLILEIPLIAEEYGGRAEIPENVLSECIRIVRKKFPQLGINELREAYRSWAASEIEVEGGEMYGGRFNAAQLGKVLAAYEKSRRQVVAAYIRERDELQSRQTEAERTRRMQESFERHFPALVERVRSTAKSWQDVPEYLFHALRKRGYLKLPQSEADAIFQEAARLADLEIEAAKQQPRNIFTPLPDRHNLRISIARKLAFWRKVVENETWKIA